MLIYSNPIKSARAWFDSLHLHLCNEINVLAFDQSYQRLNASSSVYLSSKEIMQSSLMSSHCSIEIDRFRNLVFQTIHKDELKSECRLYFIIESMNMLSKKISELVNHTDNKKSSRTDFLLSLISTVSSFLNYIDWRLLMSRKTRKRNHNTSITTKSIRCSSSTIIYSKSPTLCLVFWLLRISSGARLTWILR